MITKCSDDTGAGAGLLALLILVGLAWWAIHDTAESHDKRRDYCAGLTVTAIGGCDRHGTCGVVYSDGSRGTQSYPTVGGKCE